MRNLRLQCEEWGCGVDGCEEDAGAREGVEAGDAEVESGWRDTIECGLKSRQGLVDYDTEEVESDVKVFGGRIARVGNVRTPREGGESGCQFWRDGQADEETHAHWTAGLVTRMTRSGMEEFCTERPGFAVARTGSGLIVFLQRMNPGASRNWNQTEGPEYGS